MWPLGVKFNPFDSAVQAILNETVATVARLRELESDLQRVVALPWETPRQQAAGAELQLARLGAAVENPLYEGQYRYLYPWESALYDSDPYTLVPDPTGPKSVDPYETAAVNIFEQHNSDTHVNAGVDIQDVVDVADVTAGPLPNLLPVVLLTMLVDGSGTKHRGILPCPIPVNVDCIEPPP
jgi:hypothetical protein